MIVPSTRRALRRLTAKDSAIPDHGMAGNFWDRVYDSACEADLPKPPPLNTMDRLASSPFPKAVHAPWKRMWKGPLPPRRITPPATFGDFILPVMHSGKRRNDGRAQVQDSCVIYGDSLDPISPEVRISETGVCGPTPAQRQSDLVQAAPALDVVHQALNPQIRKPNRRPFNLYAFCNNAAATSPSFTDAGISALSYRDALMAGNHGHGHGRAFSGRGAQDHRRGRGGRHDSHGRAGQGRGRGSWGCSILLPPMLAVRPHLSPRVLQVVVEAPSPLTTTIALRRRRAQQ